MRTLAWIPFLVLFAVMGAVPAAAAAPADSFFFKPKDRVVFLGDSITEQYDYTNLLEYYLVTRLPSWDMTFLNAGIGGDTAGGGLNRAVRDVLVEKPTAVTINFGMNDGRYRKPDMNIYNDYIKNQTGLVKKLTAGGARVALLATSPIEGRRRGDGETYNETLGTFADGLKELASQNGATFVDQFHPALTVLKKMAEDKAAFDCFPDSVHTNSRGGLLMAHSILTAMHAPAAVSDVVLSADGTVTTAEKCTATNVTADKNKVTFTRADAALPLVLSADQKQLLPYLHNLDHLNRYGLKINGLDKDARFELKIDEKPVATFTGEQLDKGVNLASYDLGPITAQSSDVWKALTTKNQLLRYRFNNFRRGASGPPLLSDDDQKEMAALRAQELSLIDKSLEAHRKKVYAAAQPKPHQFEVTRVQ